MLETMLKKIVGVSTSTQRKKRGEREGYFRFLNILAPSISVTYSKPASINLHASWMSLATAEVNSSSPKAISLTYTKAVFNWDRPICSIV